MPVIVTEDYVKFRNCSAALYAKMNIGSPETASRIA